MNSIVGKKSGKKLGILTSALALAFFFVSCPSPAASGQVSTPFFNPSTGTFSADQLVTITCVTPGATIYYTTDGSAPTVASTTYSGPIPVGGNGTTLIIKAIAIAAGMTDSAIGSAAFLINYFLVSTPQFSPSTGTFNADQLVTLSCVSPGSTIYYTTDGSAPTISSAVYTAPLSVAGNGTSTTIKAIAAVTGFATSALGSAAYTINYSQVSTPQFSPSTGIYSSDQLVTISCATPGATIYYTTDGSLPTASSAAYVSPLSVFGNGTTRTIKAIALKSGMSTSTVGDASYAISYSQVSAPQFSPSAGTYSSYQLVTISEATPGTTLYYTTDGSTPSTSSPVYSSPIPLIGNGITMTIKAYGVKTGMLDSTLASATYTTIGDPGTLDPSFLATGAGANSLVRSLAVQSDGKILIGGFFSTYNGTGRGCIARVNSDGSLDPYFLATGAGANLLVYSLTIQSDGKILIGGDFTTYNGTSRGHVARLNSDGSLDVGFLATGAGANSTVGSLAVQSDGKILICGDFSTYNGTSRGRIARLNGDGSLDTSFLATGAGANSAIYSLAVQRDGKILIGGYFTAYNGTSRGYVARLNNDGSLDTSFLATGAGATDSVSSLAIQSDGKILIGGDFSTYNGTSRGRIARLNSDGSLDTSFLVTGAGANDDVDSLAVQSDGKILIGGDFTTYNGTSRGHVARLNSDGSLDTSFLAAGAGTNSYVSSLTVQSDGKILIGGEFNAYGTTSRGHVARLWY